MFARTFIFYTPGSHERCDMMTKCHIGILSLRVYYGTGSHYTDSQTSLVKTLSPVTAALELRDFNHGKQSHNWLRGTINLIISYLKLHRQEYHNCVQRLKTVFISHV